MRKFGPIWVCGLVLLGNFTAGVLAELPDFYKKVDRVVWVVDDLDTVTQGWEKLGFPVVHRHGAIELRQSTFRDKEVAVSVRAATGLIGDVQIDWLEPISKDNAYSEFLTANGPGVFALVHRVPVPEVLELERVRYEGLGVNILQSGVSTGALNWGSYSFFDTRSRGKYVLGLISSPKGQLRRAYSEDDPFAQGIAQYAFAVEEPEPVSEFWQSLGLPPLSIVPVEGRDREYKGNPASFEMELGWQRHGDVSYEWCIPLKGPTVYQDHINDHGEGFHHIGLSVEDLDGTIAQWEAMGIPVIQSGAWGEKGKPGSGRYAYMDTDAFGGIAVELLWSFKQ